MRITKILLLVSILIGAMPLSALAQSRAAGAPERDPARWYVEDTTPQAHYKTLKKEAGAAYQEALASCKTQSGSEKSACMKEAQRNLQNDLSNAKQALSQ